MLPEFAASLPALAGLCQPAAGGAASLPSPLGAGMASVLRTVSRRYPYSGRADRCAIVALPSKAALGDYGATVTVRLEPDHNRCSQRPPAPLWKAELRERTQ